MKKLNLRISKSKPAVVTEELPKAPKKPIKLNFKLPKKSIFIVLLIIGALSISVFAYLRFSSYSVRVQNITEEGTYTSSCSNILNPECWTEAFKPQLKQINGKTNALILGFDTRPNGSLLNTDTIIVASLDHATGKTMLVSIPRDFFSFRYQAKISAVYAYTRNKDKEDPFRYIKEEIASITGLQVSYVVRVYLDGVPQLIDAVGGIQVCPTSDITAKYPNPNATRTSPDQWIYVDYVKGCQDVDGFTALVYARFRHIRRGPGYLASDFSRARRQQEVINAVKDKLLKEDIPLSERVEDYWDLLKVVEENILFDFTFEDFLGGMALLESIDTTPAQVVLDPLFGDDYRLIYENTNDINGYTERSKTNDYSGIKNELNNIWKNIDFYKESPKVYVRNQSGESSLPNNSAVFTIKNSNMYISSFDVVNEDKTDKFTGIKIFDFTGGAKQGSLEIIKKTLGVSEVELLPETYGITRSSKNEDFLIVVGPN